MKNKWLVAGLIALFLLGFSGCMEDTVTGPQSSMTVVQYEQTGWIDNFIPPGATVLGYIGNGWYRVKIAGGVYMVYAKRADDVEWVMEEATDGK